MVQEEELWEIIRKNPACDDIDSEYQFNAVTDLMHNLGIILHFKVQNIIIHLYFLGPVVVLRIVFIAGRTGFGLLNKSFVPVVLQ